MTPQDRAYIERFRQQTGVRLGLKSYESILDYREIGTTAIMIQVETFKVKELRRETRYEKRGVRYLIYMKASGTDRWYLDNDLLTWDESYTPTIFDHTGRRPTPEDEAARREWEMLCHRPGSGRTPLDSYERVLDGCYTESEKKMEGYW